MFIKILNSAEVSLKSGIKDLNIDLISLIFKFFLASIGVGYFCKKLFTSTVGLFLSKDVSFFQ
jgi:hypothetical protein